VYNLRGSTAEGGLGGLTAFPRFEFFFFCFFFITLGLELSDTKVYEP